MQNLRRAALFLWLAGTLAAGGAGQTSRENEGEESKDGRIQLLVPPLNASSESSLEAVIKAMRQSYGVDLNLVRLGEPSRDKRDDAKSRALDRMDRELGRLQGRAAGATSHDAVSSRLRSDTPPNVSCVDVTEVEPLAREGLLAPIETVFAERSGRVLRFANTDLARFRFEGHLYAVPLDLGEGSPALACVLSKGAPLGLAFEVVVSLVENLTPAGNDARVSPTGRAFAEAAPARDPKARRVVFRGRIGTVSMEEIEEAAALPRLDERETVPLDRLMRAVPWTVMESGCQKHLTGIWGTTGTDVYAVGSQGCVLHYDGNAWSPVSVAISQSLTAIWGTGANDVFAVGLQGTILHFDGHAWSVMALGSAADLSAVWGVSNQDVFAVGRLSSIEGAVFHYDGVKWSRMNATQINPLDCVWGSSSRDVWVGGGGLYHYDGVKWSTWLGSGGKYGIWGNSPTNVYSVGDGGWVAHYTGGDWHHQNISLEGTSDTLTTVWGNSSSDVFAGGERGSIYHFDGRNWFLMSTGTSIAPNAIWGSSSSDVFAVGPSGMILHYDGSPWVPVLPSYQQTLGGIWGRSATDIWVAGRAGSTRGIVYHFDGKDWSLFESPVAPGLACVTGASGGRVWMGGSGFYRYGNGKWLVIYGAGGINDVWSPSPGDVFAVGNWGTVYRVGDDHTPGYTGKIYEERLKTPTSKHLLGVGGTSMSDMFIVGAEGTILHYDGQDFSAVASGTQEALESVWASAANDLFVVGSSGTALHYDGSSFSPMASGTTRSLYAVWGTSTNDVFAVGQEGTVLHWNGQVWSQMTQATSEVLLAVWGTSPSDVYAAGTDGVITHYDGTQWKIMRIGSKVAPGFYRKR